MSARRAAAAGEEGLGLSPALQRRLADLLGGSSGGWAFWRASLAAVEQALERSREREQAFCHYPPAELGRFLRELEDALELAVMAVEVQLVINDEPEGDAGRRRESVAEVLFDRAAAVLAEHRRELEQVEQYALGNGDPRLPAAAGAKPGVRPARQKRGGGDEHER